MSEQVPEGWRAARRILAVRLDGMGDLLMTTPALRALRGVPARCHLTLLTSTAGAPVAALIPECDDVIVYDAPWMKPGAGRARDETDAVIIERLRCRGFEAAVVFGVYSQNPLPAAYLCFLAGIPLRLAYCRENPYGLLSDWLPEPEPQTGLRHEVERQLDLVAGAGFAARGDKLSLRVPGEVTAELRGRLVALGLDLQRPWMVCHPGASAPSRRYPPGYFAEAVRRLVGGHGLQVIFSGSEQERSLVEMIRHRSGVPGHSLAGQMDTAELAALVALAPVLLTNNTGPAHLAAAVGTPVVDLYALTNPQHTPWRVANRVLFHDVPCRYCLRSVCPEGHHRCLEMVSPSEVVQAVLELVGLAEPLAGREPLPPFSADGELSPVWQGK